jgi:hypothetical protein
MGMTPMLRMKIAVVAVLAAILATSTVLLNTRSGDSFPHLRLAQEHFAAGNWSAAELAIRDAFQYDSLDEPMERSAWILRAKVAAAAGGDEAGLHAAETFVHIYHGTLREDELLGLQNWFTQRGFFKSADLIRGARRER